WSSGTRPTACSTPRGRPSTRRWRASRPGWRPAGPARTRSSMSYELTVIGVVESPLTDRAAAPKQGDEGSPEGAIVFESAVLDGLDGVEPGAEVIVLTWLDRANRDVLRVHPRDDLSRPEQGVFSTRSADRPNPIGLHHVHVVSIDGRRMRVRNLE